MTTAFAELGLPDAATEREVRAAWRRLASQWHPDRNPSAEAVLRMQRINRAFGAIRDAGFAPPVDWEPFAAPAPPEAEAPAPAPAARPSPETPHRPISRRVRLTLEEAAAGCVKTLRGRASLGCADCGGSGLHGTPARCRHCGGSGRQTRRNFFGWLGEIVACAACDGSGRVRHECPACAGSGSRAHAWRVQVRIPPGLRPGERLHVARTRVGAAAPPADLDIHVEWLAHPFFHVDADGTLRCELPVDGFAWIAGHEVPVPTLAGPRPLALRQGCLQYTLAGLGFAARGHQGARPDQIVFVRPVFPESPSAEQQALLAQLMASTAAHPAPALRAWQRQMAAWGKRMA
ncbi:DnaJ C-terminal domain-containing protein [Ottowia sp.]|jgi:molecular chaperone DnaJ|uniref:DnaJ C-terminal domain-containing protein n=1 Tax=Ottowia sp. TaxID=1898956 RepID=UPI0025F6DF34|nr:DnaJ C-terminal domain-containing protein [Ottowia sp.]MBK6615105.1 DnaJ domain-containing protein [Ottowia sp.]MBK6746182.1 DnaJ domain-containing protein [Ottowia sp.]